MAKTPSGNAAKKASSKEKSSKRVAPAGAAKRSPAIEVARQLDEDLNRERAYSIWMAEGRPHGQELAHWRRARDELLAAQ